MKRIVLSTVAAVLLAAFFSLGLSRHGLTVSRYPLKALSLQEPVRIVQLTDLHNSEFGSHNRRLVDKVSAQEPDLILITGDLLNLNEERTDIAEELITQLADLAPVYVSYGNHEAAYEKIFGADIRSVYTEAGAVVLDRSWEDVTVNGQQIRLGGIYGYCLPRELINTGEAFEDETEYLLRFQDTDNYRILLCHMPYSWIVQDSLDSWDVDLVLCGHVHGGQVRFPFVGGLWAPDQGWFPGRESGLYYSEDGSKTMLLSRGLGNTDKMPRFNNIPELVVLDLVPD